MWARSGKVEIAPVLGSGDGGRFIVNVRAAGFKLDAEG
jgi:hypothetical protein